MKLISYIHEGRTGYGILNNDGIVDAASRLPENADLASLLEDVSPLRKLAGLPADLAWADVTSMAEELRTEQRMALVRDSFLRNFAEAFDYSPIQPNKARSNRKEFLSKSGGNSRQLGLDFKITI